MILSLFWLKRNIWEPFTSIKRGLTLPFSEVFGGVFVLSRCFLDCSVGVWGYCHRTESDIFLFLLTYRVYISQCIWYPRACTQYARLYHTTC